MENLGKMIRGLFERGGEVPESPNELLKEFEQDGQEKEFEELAIQVRNGEI